MKRYNRFSEDPNGEFVKYEDHRHLRDAWRSAASHANSLYKELIFWRLLATGAVGAFVLVSVFGA